MSTFLSEADYGDAIRDNYLDDLIESDDAILNSCELKAIQFMKGYLNARYDVDAIFSATGDDRNPVIVMYAVDICLYYVHRRIAYKDVPEWRKERYNDAKDWLEKVNKQEINDPTLPKITDSIDRNYVRFGSNPKRQNSLSAPVSDEDETE